MNPSKEQLIKWFDARKGGVYYSMPYRNGQQINAAGQPVASGGRPGFDCSSAVYYALIEAGFLPAGHRIGNTDSLFGDLEKHGWVRASSPQRGDIFIWGVRGASGGAAGHTGVFIGQADVIHCAAFANSITTNNYSQLRGWNDNPVQTYYHFSGSTQTSEGDNDQNLDVGSMIRFDRTYTVNDVQHIGNIWQVKTDELCRAGFTWDDNGIPAEPLVEVDDDGYATPDQNLNPGSKYVIPGKYEVLELGQYEQYWLALISWNGFKFWVDVETLTEIKRSEPGREAPGQRPVAPSEPQPPITPPVIDAKPETPPAPEPDPQPEPTPPTEPEPEVPTPPTPQPDEEEDVPQQPNKPQEETKMAFTQQQHDKLQVATQSVLDANDFKPVISDRVKTIAYFATDTIAILSGLVLTILAVLSIVDGTIALMLNSALVAAMLGFKQTFRLSAKKQ